MGRFFGVTRTGFRVLQQIATDKLEAAKLKGFILRQYRRRLQGSPSDHVAHNLNRRRFARRKTVELARALRTARTGVIAKQLLAQRACIASPILDALCPDRRRLWQLIVRRDIERSNRVIKLSNFTFIDDPDRVLSLLKEVAEVDATDFKAYLDFEDPYCIDMGAYLVLAEVRQQLTGIFEGGAMPVPLQKVIEAVGLRKPLHMRLSSIPDRRPPSDVWAFPLRRRRPAGKSSSGNLHIEPQAREKVADEFCDKLNHWLSEAHSSLELSPEGKASFSDIIGELLDNAERHSVAGSADGSWSIAAFMARRQEHGVDTYRCYMAFLSVGQSMAEGLATAQPEIVASIRRYCNMHARSGQSAETLATLCALQDGVTRDRDAASKGRGGIGFQVVLDVVHEIGGTADERFHPKLTIVSGNACIKLGSKYFKGQRAEVDGPRTIWCNPTNSPMVPPDADCVFDLSNRLAGTLVTLTFVLDGEFLKALANDGNQSR